jgi:hypothetical protein
MKQTVGYVLFATLLACVSNAVSAKEIAVCGASHGYGFYPKVGLSASNRRQVNGTITPSLAAKSLSRKFLARSSIFCLSIHREAFSQLGVKAAVAPVASAANARESANTIGV